MAAGGGSGRKLEFLIRIRKLNAVHIHTLTEKKYILKQYIKNLKGASVVE